MSGATALTGGLTSYYLAQVVNPQREEQGPYQAECEDIIRALNMTFDEGCEFKAIWRTAAARMGNGKPGQKAVYDAEKRLHYANASLRQLQYAARIENREWITHTGSTNPAGTALVDYICKNGEQFNGRAANTLSWAQVSETSAINSWRLSRAKS